MTITETYTTTTVTKPTVKDLDKMINHIAFNTNGKKVVIFHHNDMDGSFAAWSAWCYLLGEFDNIEIIPINYDQQDDNSVLEKIDEGDVVFVLDFAFSRSVTEAISALAEYCMTLDHHKTNQENVQGLSDVYFDMTASGAKMAYEYFFGEGPVPLAITLADNRDLWKKTDGREDTFHEALMVEKSMASSHRDFITGLGKYTLESEVTRACSVGETIIHKRDSDIAYVTSESKLTNVSIAGHPTIMFNYGVNQSNACESVYTRPEYRSHIVIAYSINNEGIVGLSLRRGPDCTVDLSDFAKTYFDGGGHSAAAGGAMTMFTLANLLETKVYPG